ncbi:MAG: hypothetical protein AAF664_24545 [Planctomycetota bacterium]
MNDHSEDQMDLNELQRLIDGTMTAEQRQFFLQLADENPEHWRTIALAFVEEQTLRHELTSLSNGLGLDLPAASPNLHASRPSDRNRSRWLWLLSQAALLLLMLGLGAYVGRQAPPNGKNNGGDYLVVLEPSIETADPPTGQATDRPTNESDSVPENYAVNWPPNGRDDKWRRSLELASRPVFDEDSRRFMQGQGYNVFEEPVIYLVEDTDGTHYALPHRRASLQLNSQ